MEKIEIQEICKDGEQINYINDYLGSKINAYEGNSTIEIEAGKWKILLVFNDEKEIKNFVNYLEQYYLNNKTDIEHNSPKRIELIKDNGKKLQGEYSYLEFINKEKPSFFISINNNLGGIEIYFYFDIKEEFDKFLKKLNKNNLKEEK